MRKVHTSFDMLIICEDSAFRKRAPERLWEVVAT